MIPHTVPKRPMYGVMLAVVARKGTRLSSLFTSTDAARSSARSRAARLLMVGRATACGTGRCRAAEAQLRIELGITRLEDADQRAFSQRLADGLHFRELVAAAKHLEERRRLAFRSAEDPQLEENDGPGSNGKENQDEQDGLLDRAGTSDHLEQVVASRGPAVPLHLHEQKQAERAQTCLRVICKSAAGTARIGREYHAA